MLQTNFINRKLEIQLYEIQFKVLFQVDHIKHYKHKLWAFQTFHNHAQHTNSIKVKVLLALSSATSFSNLWLISSASCCFSILGSNIITMSVISWMSIAISMFSTGLSVKVYWNRTEVVIYNFISLVVIMD